MTIEKQSKRNEQADAAYQWWFALTPHKRQDGSLARGDRAALARLRRCSSLIEAIAEPPTGKLFYKLGLAFPRDERYVERVAVLAVALAHVRDNDRRRIALAIGAPPGGEPNEALVKPNRFRTLMAARTDNEIMSSFRRVIAMLGGSANVKDLAHLILSWNDDDAGDRTRANFAFAYFGAADAAPDADNEQTDAPEAITTQTF